MKAIETIYNGYRFRSRLEARWAVFFDALGVEYEYEPEGFDLGGGLYYLPDFRVKCWGVRGVICDEPFDLYIEVKGNMTRSDAAKILSFVNGEEINMSLDDALFYGVKKNNPLLIVGEIPKERKSSDSSVMKCYDCMNEIEIYPFNYHLIDGDYFGAYPAAFEGKFFLWGDTHSQVWNEDEVEAAYATARQARFKHGERG